MVPVVGVASITDGVPAVGVPAVGVGLVEAAGAGELAEMAGVGELVGALESMTVPLALPAYAATGLFAVPFAAR